LSDLSRRFFRLSLINIAASVTVPLVGLVDTAMLGHLPDIRFLAGVALASLLFDYAYWTLGFLRMGTTGMTAQAMGRRDTVEVTDVLRRGLLTAFVLAGLVLVLQVPLREAGFALLTGEPGVEQAGREYFDARIWGAPAALAGFVLVGWFLGREESRHVLVMTAVANLANVLLNYVFIIRLGLAARGAGLASMASQYLMLGVGVWIYLRHRKPVPWHGSRVFDRDRLRGLFLLNRDLLVRTLCLVSAFALFVNSSSALGTRAVARAGAALRLRGLHVRRGVPRPHGGTASTKRDAAQHDRGLPAAVRSRRVAREQPPAVGRDGRLHCGENGYVVACGESGARLVAGEGGGGLGGARLEQILAQLIEGHRALTAVVVQAVARAQLAAPDG
jgi:MATE family multidrug resistance protein